MTETIDVALRFVECINRADLEGLCALMSEDHCFIDLAGDVETGRELMRDGWRTYFAMCPEYMIHICVVHDLGDRAALIGRTTGSHLRQSRTAEFNSGTLIWVADIEAGRVREWRLLEDTSEARTGLGLPLA